MTRPPGTAPAFDDLRGWVAAARQLEARRASFRRYDRIAAHWAALPLDLVTGSDDRPALERLLALLHQLGPEAWRQPPRGQRGGTQWERVNMAAKNRLRQLARAEDLPMTGHNSRMAAGEAA